METEAAEAEKIDTDEAEPDKMQSKAGGPVSGSVPDGEQGVSPPYEKRLRLDFLPTEIRREIVRIAVLDEAYHSGLATDTFREIGGVPCKVGEDGKPKPITHSFMFVCRTLYRDFLSVRWDVAIFCFDDSSALKAFRARFERTCRTHKRLAVWASVTPGSYKPAEGALPTKDTIRSLAIWFKELAGAFSEPILAINFPVVFSKFEILSALAERHSLSKLKPMVVFDSKVWHFHVAIARGMDLEPLQFDETAWMQEATRAAIYNKPLPPFPVALKGHSNEIQRYLLRAGVTGF